MRVLDVKGLRCPQPILRTRKAMLDVPPGERLTVLATDPSAVIDFRVYCDHVGHKLVSITETPGLLTFEIEKAAARPARIGAVRPSTGSG